MPNQNFVFIYQSKGIELSPIENMKNMAVHLLYLMSIFTRNVFLSQSLQIAFPVKQIESRGLHSSFCCSKVMNNVQLAVLINFHSMFTKFFMLFVQPFKSNAGGL